METLASASVCDREIGDSGEVGGELREELGGRDTIMGFLERRYARRDDGGVSGDDGHDEVVDAGCFGEWVW